MKRGFTLVELMMIISIIAILGALIFLWAYKYTSSGRGMWNRHMYAVQKTDDVTRYETRKNVEDTCRAMQASYQSDVSTVRVYRRSGHSDWADQLVIRANRTAASYNEYVRKNSFVWQGNIPADIDVDLPMAE